MDKKKQILSYVIQPGTILKTKVQKLIEVIRYLHQVKLNCIQNEEMKVKRKDEKNKKWRL